MASFDPDVILIIRVCAYYLMVLAGCFYFKCRVECIEVPGIQPVGDEAESLTETLEVYHFTFPQETDRITYFRILDQA